MALNNVATLVAQDLIDIEEAVAQKFPNLRERHPETFAGLCASAAQVYAARLVANETSYVADVLARHDPHETLS